MARVRVLAVLTLAITIGGVFAYGTYQYIQAMPTRTVTTPTRPVVVASTNLDIGAELRREDLRLIDWPTASVPAAAFEKTEDVVGRGLIVPVVQSEPILAAKLASKEAGTGLPPAIPAGMRALSVRVNDVIGVAGYVLPGTHVDVVATVTPTEQHTDITSKVILTNVQVLTAGTKIERDVEHNKPVAVSVVTLLVDPAEAERLTLASTEGKIQLALRNPLDKTMPQTPGIRPAALLGFVPAARASAASRQTAAPRPVRLPDPPPTVEMIRGDKRAQEIVRQE